MKISDAVNAMCEALEAEGRSPQTLVAYRRHLKQLADYLGDVDLERVSVADLRGYAAMQRRRARSRQGIQATATNGLSEHSISTYIRSVRRLFSWLSKQGMADSRLAKSVAIPKADLSDFKAAHAEDVQRMINACNGHQRQDVRDRALIGFMASSGCRVGGIIHLRLEDCDCARGRARVFEKGGKCRTVFFEPWVGEAVVAWLAVRPPVTEPWLFVALGTRMPGAQLTQSAIGQIFKRRKKSGGIRGKANPHSFRHAFAVRYLSRGGSVGTLSQILGHGDVSTTVRYYGRLSQDELHAQYRRFGETGLNDTQRKV